MINKQIIKNCRAINLYDLITKNEQEMSSWYADGKYLRSKKDKCVIKRNGSYFFNDDDNNFGRNAINFFCEYKNFTFADALNYIKRYADVDFPKDKDIIYDYLHEDRKIDKKIISKLIKDKKVSVKCENNYTNIIFSDNKGNPFEAVGIAGRKYKRRYNFNEYWTFGNDKSTVCYVCESAIDALSLYEILRDKKACYVSLGGESKRKYLIAELMKRYKKVILAVDNDDEGDNIAKAYHYLDRLKPQCKDWNEDLSVAKVKEADVA